MTEPTEAVEATDETGEQTAEFKGQTFKLNPDVSEWAFMEFAEAADAGQDAGTLAGMASLLRFVLELVDESDRDRFRQLARRERVKSEELVEFMLGKAGDDAERPTERSSDSSDGPTRTPLKSVANSDGKGSPTGGLSLVEIIRARPDLAVFYDTATPKAG